MNRILTGVKIVVLAVLLVTVVLAAGCWGDDGDQRTSARPAPTMDDRPVSPREWRAVISDWYEGGPDQTRIDRHHRCAAVRKAIEELPDTSFAYHDPRRGLTLYAEKVCPRERMATAIKTFLLSGNRMTPDEVRRSFGQPDEVFRDNPRALCWAYYRPYKVRMCWGPKRQAAWISFSVPRDEAREFGMPLAPLMNRGG